jgi:hypothetical protein
MRIKQGTTIPYAYQIRDSEKDPVDLTNAASVVFKGTKDGNTTPDITITCNFTDRTDGDITIPWTSGSTSVIGFYFVEFVITWSDGSIEKVPSGAEEWLLIMNSYT